MKKIAVLVFSCLCLWMTAQEKMEHQLLVQLKSGVDINDWLAHQPSQFPINAEWQLLQQVSLPMRVYLIGWQEMTWSDEEVLRWFKKQPEVTMAQYNHILTERLIPNDLLFGNQWHHVDPQDNDIDADLAWEITSGGNTALGDEIVACVVETNGAKWNQEDLIENHWVNILETAGNNIDDDGNGYIDDVDGWNVTNNNDNLSTGNHGTQVSSMIGAKGNNGLGVSGVNWDVKIMQVQMGGISEANAIAAYTYPMVMRKLYNNTNGQQGAFVVVTNSSWGIDNGQASDSPLWCQMYDSLGFYGILSCAATANNNVNIDQVGDLPTTCPSNYMIAVTATNSSDVRTFSGYGTTHIDLGAPGEAVLMAGNTSYATSSGTSFASPCVAGAVALMYSAPCVSLAQVAQDNPALAAQWVKNYLLDGVDPVANLQNEVATGGRLNIKNSLDLAMSNCVTGDCPAPFSVQYAPISGTSGELVSWSTLSPSLAQVQYHPVGATDWQVIDSITGNQISLLDLLYCTTYEFQVRLYCDTIMSEWSNLISFLTDGCCQHPDYFQTSNPTADAISIQWNSVLASNGYTVQLFNDLAGNITYTTDLPQITLDSLLPCTQYQAMVYANCVNPGDQLISIPFQTLGCTSCADIPFCEATTGSASTEWIANVTLAGINNTTLSDGGYGNYTDVTTTLNTNQNYAISITPGFSGLAYYEYFRVWLDWNANGIWEDNELAWDPGVPSNTVTSGNLMVPVNAQLGSVRMRVGMTYYGLSGSGEMPLACGTFNYGEFEDYCIQIANNSVVNELQGSQEWLITPNPTSAYFLPPAGAYGMHYEILDATGKIYLQGKVQGQIGIDELASGCYFIKWKKADEVHFSKLMKN